MADARIEIDAKVNATEAEKDLKRLTNTAQSEAMKLAAVYRKQGMSQSDAAKTAWSDVKKYIGVTSAESEAAGKKIENSVGGAFQKTAAVSDEEFNKIKKHAKSAGLAVSAAVSGAVTGAALSGMKFESAFAGVKKTVDATEDQLTKLRDGIREMAKEIPLSAEEIAGIAESAGQLGIETDNILTFTRTMADLGVATNLAGEEAASTLAKFANITQMPQEQFSNLGSAIVDLGNHLATTESDIAAMSLRLAGAGSQIGMTEADILSFAGALSSVGIEAEAGGSAFSRLMSDMQLAVETSSGDLKAYANVAGMSGDKFKKAFKSDAAGALIEFIKGLNNTERNGKSATQVLEDMGIKEIRLTDALKRAAGASNVFENAVKLGNKAWDENNALTNEAAQRYETTESKLKIIGNGLKDLGITAYDTMKGPFNEALDSAGDKLSELSDSMTNGALSEATEGVGELFGSIVSAAVDVADVAIPAIANLASGLANLSGAIVPATAGFAAFKTATTSVTLFNKAVETAPNIIGKLTTPTGIVSLAIGGLVTAVLAVKNAAAEAEYEFFHMGDALEESAQKFDDAKTKADLTEDYAGKWRDLNAAISDGSLSGEELAEAERKRKDYEQWFIDNYGDYISAEEQKNGIRDESIEKIEEIAEELSETARLELENQALALQREVPDLAAEISDLATRNKEMENSNKNMLEQNAAIQKGINEYKNFCDQGHSVKECYEKLQEVTKKINDEYDTSFDNIADLDTALDLNNKILEENKEKISENTEKIDAGKASLQTYTDTCRKLTENALGDTLDGFASGFDLVKQAISEIEQTGQISEETYQRLIEKFPEMKKSLENAEDAPQVLNEKMEEMNGKLDVAGEKAKEFGVLLNGLPKHINIDVKLNTPQIPTSLRLYQMNVKGPYARGTAFAAEGPAIVNDGNGPELIQSKNGDFKMVQSKGAALTYLHRGDRVYTAEQTRAMLKHVPHYANGIGNDGYTGTVTITSFVEKVPEAFDKAMDELELRRDLDVIDEEQYYTELEKLRDGYFEKGSDKWWDYEKELYNHRKETAEKAAEEAAEKAEKARNAELDAIERQHETGLLSEQDYIDELTAYRNRYYAEGADEFAEMTDKINDLSRQNERDMLQYQYDLGILTERKYYDKLTEYRDKYFVAGSHDWLDYTNEIYQYHIDKIKASYDELAEYAKEQLADIEAAQGTLSQKLADNASFYRTVTIKNAYEDGSDMVFKELKDWTPDIEKLKRYNDAVDAAKERILSGGFDEKYAKKFLDKLLAESVEDGTEFAELLAKSTDEELKKHLDGFAEYQKLSESVAAHQYETEIKAAEGVVSAIENECETAIKDVKEQFFGSFTEALEQAGLTVPDGFFDIGRDSAESFGEGFSENLEEICRKIKEQFNFDVIGSLAAAADGGTTTYSTFAPVYNFYDKGESTTQRIWAAQAATERDKLSGGY